MVNWAQYRDMSKHMLPPEGTQIHNPFLAAVTSTAPQLITEIFGMFADTDNYTADEDASIDNLTNNDTRYITTIVRELKTATGDKKTRLEADLDLALKEYYTKHNVGDNKTIDNLPQAAGYKS